MTEPQVLLNAQCPVCYLTSADGLLLSNILTLSCKHILCKDCYKQIQQHHQKTSNQTFVLVCPYCKETHKSFFQQIPFEHSDPALTQFQFTNFKLITTSLESMYGTLLGFYSEYAPHGYITDLLITSPAVNKLEILIKLGKKQTLKSFAQLFPGSVECFGVPGKISFDEQHMKLAQQGNIFVRRILPKKGNTKEKIQTVFANLQSKGFIV